MGGCGNGGWECGNDGGGWGSCLRRNGGWGVVGDRGAARLVLGFWLLTPHLASPLEGGRDEFWGRGWMWGGWFLPAQE